MNLELANKKIILTLKNFLINSLKGNKIFWIIFFIFLIGFTALAWIYVLKPTWYPKIQNEQIYNLEIDQKLFNSANQILEQRKNAETEFFKQ